MDTTQAQEILSNIGLLDPPADGKLGPVTKWALSEFCAGAAIPFDGSTITNAVAKSLAAAEPLPLDPSNDLAGRIVSAMLAKDYFIARHNGCLNIVYIEGMNPDGTLNGNRPNYFDSVRCLIRIGDGGVPKMVGIWEGTTEPSRYWTEHPMNPNGAARIAFGQYKSWVMGEYHKDNALIEADDITVYRDPQMLYKRYGQPTSGEFGIHHHHGYDFPKNDEKTSSAGCLVGRLNDGHEEFMALVRTDARYKANPNYKFMATVLPVEDLPGAAAEPIINKPAPAPAPTPPPSADRTFDAYRSEYTADWRSMVILPNRQASVQSIAAKLLGHKARYQTVESKTGVPWYVIAVLHERESGADFTTHLHNGDPLTARTVHVPAGRPTTGNPPFTWEESAIDALTIKGLDAVSDWPIERIAYECEKYNGWGYRAHGVPSAYLWSFSNIYRGGKYVADRVWSAEAQDQQCGVMPLTAQLSALDSSVDLGISEPSPTPKPAEPPAPPTQPPSPPVIPGVTTQQPGSVAAPPVPPAGTTQQPGPVATPPAAPGRITPMTPDQIAQAILNILNAVLAQRNVGGQASSGTLVPLAGTPVPLADILQTLSAVLKQTPQGSTDGTLLGIQQLLDQLSKIPGSATPVLPTTTANDPTTILQQLANVVKSLNVGTPIAGTASTQQQVDQLQKILDSLKSNLIAGGQSQSLGQVNGALGQTIGNLLNGKKTAIGIIGALVTALLSNVPEGSGLADVLAKITPVAGFGGYMMPAFLALAAWGALGKLEKWAQGTAPPPTSTK